MQPKILAFSGSLRQDSYNQRLVEAAAEMARSRGAEVDVVSLRDFDMPLFSEDLEREQGTPEDVTRFKALLKSHDGFIIGCPEYNSSITAALKNAIDWATRPAEGEKPLECFAGKVAALVAASPGGLGGLRGLDHVREILGNIQVHIVPGMVSVPNIHTALDDANTITDERARNMLDQLTERLCTTVHRLHGDSA